MKKKLNKDLWKVFEDEGTIIEIDVPQFDSIVDNDFVKTLRNQLDLTQNVFSNVLGVTKKTIEKWEQGANPIKGPAARLLYLINNDPSLVNKLYSVNIISNIETNEKYKIQHFIPLVNEKHDYGYKVSQNDSEVYDSIETQFTSNQFEVNEGGVSWRRTSKNQLFTS